MCVSVTYVCIYVCCERPALQKHKHIWVQKVRLRGGTKVRQKAGSRAGCFVKLQANGLAEHRVKSRAYMVGN